MNRIHLCFGILERDGEILMVASRYANHSHPLWNLPGGRQEPYELLPDTLRREFREEVSLEIEVGALAYVAESFDRSTETHFTTTAFRVASSGEPKLGDGDVHAVQIEWVLRERVGARLSVDVVRTPLLRHLAGEPAAYYGASEAGITIEFLD
ncbi:MAG: NUDIX hydrolase [Candidatus Eremiobacteraeota bacterium]|nr:NUDIX hydrolase [Candidatus Eremiobacteraeota bacterium]MBV8355323.1 NUDIX hydrolase [Candidatus Eremiobacteraeota bacterium]